MDENLAKLAARFAVCVAATCSHSKVAATSGHGSAVPPRSNAAAAAAIHVPRSRSQCGRAAMNVAATALAANPHRLLT